MNPAIEDQLIEAAVDQIKDTRDTSLFRPFVSGDADVDGALAESKLVSTAEDRAVIYHIETGEPREILVNMLAKTLRKRKDGKPVFSVTPVAKKPFEGSTPCWLHPDHPDREEFDAMGLRDKVCMSGKLASEYDAGEHMRKRHRSEYRLITEMRAAQRDEETRDFQRQQMELLRQLAEKAVGGGAAAAPTPEIFWCKAEGCGRFFDSAVGLSMHTSKEHK